MHEGPQVSNSILKRYILPGERVVIATRKHWAKVLEPVGTAVAALIAVLLIIGVAGDIAAVHFLWFAWLAVVARSAWMLLEWRNEWFVATDRRVLRIYGLITHKVAMMPLRKVNDMNYVRSPLGRVLGFGSFLVESAGHDDAMREIDWVVRPDETYRVLCDTLFSPNSHDPDDGPTTATTMTPLDPHASPVLDADLMSGPSAATWSSGVPRAGRTTVRPHARPASVPPSYRHYQPSANETQPIAWLEPSGNPTDEWNHGDTSTPPWGNELPPTFAPRSTQLWSHGAAEATPPPPPPPPPSLSA